MPKRNRTKEQRSLPGPRPATPAGAATVAPAVESEQARAARLFAASVKSHEAADAAERERRATVAANERRHEELVAAKESAAALIRRLRADGRPRQKMADAEAAYRAALAELSEFETGERPHWAPAAPPVESTDEALGEPSEESTDEPA